MLACSTNADSAPSAGDTGCASDSTDANLNGRADARERTLLATFQTPTMPLGDPSEHVLVSLVYGADDVEADGLEFRPGFDLWFDDPGPFTVETSTLAGWDDVEAGLVDERDDPLTTRVREQDFDRTLDWTWRESELGIFGKMRSDDLHAVGVEVVEWDLEDHRQDMSVVWYFFGAPGVR